MKTIIKLLLIILFFGVSILFNIGLIDIRLEEIKYLLGNIAAKEDVSNTFGIVAKYELIKRRMLYGEENVTNYEFEAKVQALSYDKNQLDDRKKSWTEKAYRIPVRLVLNSIRVLQGKKIINPKDDDKIFTVLEIAYFFERNRKYNDALKSYEEILLNTDIASDLRAAVMVHKAFCYSMLSDYGKSKKEYEDVIALFPNTEAGIIAWKLLDFIQSIERERKKLENTQLKEMEKAKQYYLLMDYRNAIKTLSVFIEKDNTDALCEARFFKGRAHEELGEFEEAVLEYKKIIRTDKSKNWARQANRRLLMLGSFYEQQKQIAEEAKQQLEFYKDQVFLSNIEMYSNFVNGNSIKTEMMNKEVNSVVHTTSSDSIVSIINKIENLDLTGEKKKEKQKNEQIRRELIKQGKIDAAEIKELERRQNLAQNPYRRPEALKKVIDDNSGELRYIYNKKLRSGIKISGKLLVEIHIKSSGIVDRANVIQSTVGDAQFEDEIVQRIVSWRFNAVADSLGDLTVNYPFEFYEEQ